jgi:group I intron endonuclease
MNCGIYCITSPSGRRYIGSAQNLIKREREHRSALKCGRHHSRPLQRAWDKYETINFSILLICAKRDLFFYEQKILDGLRPEYNVNPSATGTRGLKWSTESRAAIKGRKVNGALVSAGMLRTSTPEQRRERARHARAAWTKQSKCSQVSKLTGRKQPVDERAKRAASLIGRPVSPETREKLAKQRGWKHTEEAKAKMRGPRK